MEKYKNIIKTCVLVVVFITSGVGLTYAVHEDEYSAGLKCPTCKEEMVHITEKDEKGKIHCKTCGNKISKTDKEHYCTNCGARIEDFSLKVPF